MKKSLLIITCLLFALFLLPGGMASWGDTLSIGGSVSIVEEEEDLDEELDTLDDFFTGEEEQEGETSESGQDSDPEPDPEPAPEPVTYELSISINGSGSTSPEQGDHIYNDGDEIELKATPADGWKFDKWIVNEEETLSAPTIKINIYEDVSIEAVFVQEPDSSKDDNDDTDTGSKDKDEPGDGNESKDSAGSSEGKNEDDSGSDGSDTDKKQESSGEEKPDDKNSDTSKQDSDLVEDKNDMQDQESDES